MQHAYGALMNSCLPQYATVFPIKNKFQPVILTFYFDLENQNPTITINAKVNFRHQNDVQK